MLLRSNTATVVMLEDTLRAKLLPSSVNIFAVLLSARVSVKLENGHKGSPL